MAPGTIPAGAAPMPEPRRDPVGKPLSEGLASALSIGGTIVSVGLLVGAGYLVDQDHDTEAAAVAIGGGLGLLIAPSSGHFYAGKYFPRGMWLRLSGVAAGGIAILVAKSADDLGDAGISLLLLIGGSVAVLAGAFDDMISVSDHVSRRNQMRGFAIAPVVTPSSAGLALGGRF
jgi:hypothetical protein